MESLQAPEDGPGKVVLVRGLLIEAWVRPNHSHSASPPARWSLLRIAQEHILQSLTSALTKRLSHWNLTILGPRTFKTNYKESGRERSRSSTCRFTPQMVSATGARPGKTRELGVSSRSPTGLAGVRTFGPSVAALLRLLADSWIEGGAARTPRSTHNGCCYCKW